MPLNDQVVQVLALLSGETVQREIIQDEQIRRQVAAEDALLGVVATRLAEIFEQPVGTREHDAVAGSDGGSAERLDQKRLADADGSDQNDVLLALQELEREDVLELVTVDVHGRAPIERVQRDTLLKAGLIEMPFKGLLLAALDLVGEQQRQKGGVIELLGARQRESLGQRGYELTQLQAFEQTQQIRIEAHEGSSPVGVTLATTGG